MVAVVYHDDLKEMQADNALAATVGAPLALAPFDRAEWWALLESHCAIKPLIAVAVKDGQRAVLPLVRRDDGLHALANWYNFRVRPLVSDGADAAALLTALARDLTKQAPRLLLAPLPDEQNETTVLAAALHKAGWVVFVTQCDVNHVLDVGGRNFADYLAGRPGQVRTTLKRKAAKVTVELADRFDPTLWDEYEAVYAASWKPEEGSPPFLRAFAEAEGAAGRLRMAIARADGAAVAAQFWTVEHGTAFIHKLAHTEASKPLSPGTTLSAALFEQVIDRDKVSLVDFGTGNDGYKRDWMEQVRPRFRIEAFRPESPANWPKIAKLALRKALGRG